MAIISTLFEHANFAGASSTSNSASFRYYWNRYTGSQNDLYSSMMANGGGDRGNVYAFEHIDFSGRYASLNVGGAYNTAWWSYFGDDFNDQVSSSLIVARSPVQLETEVALRAQVVPRFSSIFDAKTFGKPVSRKGDPRLYATYFPSYDRNSALLTIDQKLNVKVRIPLKIEELPVWTPWSKWDTIDIPDIDTLEKLRWSDYEATVRYDVEFFVIDGKLQAAARWLRLHVEDGLLHDRVYEDLFPQLMDAAQSVTDAFQSALALFAMGRFSDVYLLPGRPPSMNLAGENGSYDDDVTLVIVRA